MHPTYSKRRQFDVPSVEVAEELPPHIDNAIYRRLQSSIIYRCRCDFDLCADDLGQQTEVYFLGANRRSRIADYHCQLPQIISVKVKVTPPGTCILT